MCFICQLKEFNMARSRASARQAGPRFEREIADYLRDHLDDRIDRRVKTGSADKGDIGGVRLPSSLGGGRVVIEAKNVMKMALGPWYSEASVERINDGAIVGVVAHKRHGTGDPGQQWVTMTINDLIALLSGSRPE
jgi:hypothetical protein